LYESISFKVCCLGTHVSDIIVVTLLAATLVTIFWMD
jgi:hypothetical protein